MLCRIAAALLALATSFPATAQITTPPPSICPPGSVSARLPDGTEVCATPDPRCQLADFPDCPGRPAPRTPVAAMICEIRIQYTQGDPANPMIAAMGPWCDSAGTELAVAVMLARLLGAR